MSPVKFIENLPACLKVAIMMRGKNLMKKFLFLALLLVFIQRVHGKSELLKLPGIGVGTYVGQFNQMQRSAAGSTNSFSVNPTFILSYALEINETHFFDPWAGYVYHRNTTSNYAKRTYFLLWNFKWNRH